MDGSCVWRDHWRRGAPPSAQFDRSCRRRQADNGAGRRALGDREPSVWPESYLQHAAETANPTSPHHGLHSEHDAAISQGITTEMKLGLVIASHGRPDILQKVLMNLVSQPRDPG